MKYEMLYELEEQHILKIAHLLHDLFPHTESWKSYDHCLEDATDFNQELDIKIGAFDGNELVGFIGGIKEYQGHTYELHPLIVQKEYQNKGIGSRLVQLLEEECKLRHVTTIMVGSDDENNMTSLYGKNLYPNLYEEIKHISNSNNHPYTFYLQNGFKITGIIPDANGIGKPDIILCKRIK